MFSSRIFCRQRAVTTFSLLATRLGPGRICIAGSTTSPLPGFHVVATHPARFKAGSGKHGYSGPSFPDLSGNLHLYHIMMQSPCNRDQRNGFKTSPQMGILLISEPRSRPFRQLPKDCVYNKKMCCKAGEGNGRSPLYGVQSRHEKVANYP